jgi:hypothetical protein
LEIKKKFTIENKFGFHISFKTLFWKERKDNCRTRIEA